MKTEEDEAFDELAKRQGAWGGGFPAKRAMAADKLLEKATRSCNHIDEQRALDALMREALAQPAQEPVSEALKLALNGITKVPTLTHGSLIKLADVDAVIDKILAQPMQELDCNDCENANRSEQVGPCADCIPFFPVRPMFMAKKLASPLPAQPAQEPVAWVWKDMRGQDIVSLFEPRFNSVPLYTAPPQREWVGLTPEDILDLFDEQNLYGSKLVEFARAVETKLKNKNI